jgi:hypothetical protein
MRGEQGSKGGRERMTGRKGRPPSGLSYILAHPPAVRSDLSTLRVSSVTVRPVSLP